LVFAVKPEAIQFLSSAGVIGPVVIVPLILQNELHASNETIGLIAGGFAAAGFMNSPPRRPSNSLEGGIGAPDICTVSDNPLL